MSGFPTEMGALTMRIHKKADTISNVGCMGFDLKVKFLSVPPVTETTEMKYILGKLSHSYQ